MIAIASIVIIWRAAEVLATGDIRIESIDVGVLLLLATVVVNGGVGAWLLSLGRRHGSPALRADGKHLLSDAVTTGAAILALIAVRFTGWTWIDPVVAIVLGISIGFVGVRVVRRSLGDLVDEQDLRDFERIEVVLDAHCGAQGRDPKICSWHKLRVRHVGREHWVDFHLCVSGQSPVREAHDVASAIEHEIEQILGPGDATAHLEPCEDPACERCA